MPDAHNSFAHPTLLIETGNYVIDAVFGIMLGEKSREIRHAALLDEGEDYERVVFQWINPTSLNLVDGKR